MTLPSTMIGLCVTLEVLAITAVCLRFWCKHLLKRKLLLHDVFIVLGLICATGTFACVVLSIQYGGGLGHRYVELLTALKSLIFFAKMSVAGAPIWAASMTFVRLSILSLYIDILALDHHHYVTCYTAMGVTTLWFVVAILGTFLLCRPLAYNWDATIPGGHCGDTTAAYIALHAANVAIDVIVAMLPIPVLWNIQLPTRKKLTVMAMFALGGLICVISTARIVLFKLIDGRGLDFEVPYSAAVLGLFTAMEPLLGVVLACIPLLRPAGKAVSRMFVTLWTRSKLTTSSALRLQPKESPDQNRNASSDTLKTNQAPFHQLPDDSRSICASTHLHQTSFELEQV